MPGLSNATSAHDNSIEGNVDPPDIVGATYDNVDNSH